MFVARTGVFLEKEFLSKGTSGRKVDLELIQEQSMPTEMEPEQAPQSVVDPQGVVEIETVPVAQSVRRYGRVRNEPKRYKLFVTHTGDVMLMDDEPTTY